MSINDDREPIEHHTDAVSRSTWAKVMRIDALFLAGIDEGRNRDQLICESLQKTFDILARECIAGLKPKRTSPRPYNTPATTISGSVTFLREATRQGVLIVANHKQQG